MECPRAVLNEPEAQELWATLLRSAKQHEIETKNQTKRDIIEIDWPAVIAYQLARLTGDTEELQSLVTLVQTINAS